MRSRSSRTASLAVDGQQAAAAGRNALPGAFPFEALDDRIAIVGTAGSGKTYAAKGFVERLLDSGARVAIVDPLGVWWGLRASADGGEAGYRRRARPADRQCGSGVRHRSLRAWQQRVAAAFHGRFFRSAVRGQR